MNFKKNFIIKFTNSLCLYSLDEIPNLINILKGEMNFIGPRPAMPNQQVLLLLRNEFGINRKMPGITGLAQVSGRDRITIYEKVKFEKSTYKKIIFV